MFPTKNQIIDHSSNVGRLTRLVRAIEAVLTTEQWQPLLEAALKHSIPQYSDPKQVQVELRKSDNRLREAFREVAAIKNGEGFSETQKQAIEASFQKAAASRRALAEQYDTLIDNIKAAMQNEVTLEYLIKQALAAYPKAVKIADAFCAALNEAAEAELKVAARQLEIAQAATAAAAEVATDAATDKSKLPAKPKAPAKGKAKTTNPPKSNGVSRVVVEPYQAPRKIKPGSTLAKSGK